MTRKKSRTTPSLQYKHLGALGLATLVLWLGLQIFHVYLPGVIDYLTIYFAPEQQALYALATFAMVLLMPLAYRLLGERGLLIVTVVGIALVRLAIQFIDSQSVGLVLSTIGVILWIWFIPFWHQSRYSRPGEKSLAGMVIAFPLAIFLDTASRGLIWFDEIAWQNGLWPIVVTIALVAGMLWLLWREVTVTSDQLPATSEEPVLSRLWPFLGVGPALYLLLIVFSSPAKLMPFMPGVDIRWVYLFVLGLTAFGVFEAIEATRFFTYRSWLVTLLLGGVLVVSLYAFDSAAEPGWLWFGLAGITTWALFGILLNETSRREPLKPGLWRDGVVTFLALLLMMLIFFLVDEFGLSLMNVAAGVIVLLAGLWAAWAGQGDAQTAPTVVPDGAQRLIVGVLLIGFAAFGLWAWQSQPVQVDGTPFTAVFPNGEYGYACYRIPSLVRAGDGSLVAFAEGWEENCGDGNGIIRVVSKRSVDNGRTWGPLQVIGEFVDDAGVEHAAQSPTALVDLTDPENPEGNLYLFFNKVGLERGALGAQRVGEHSAWLTQSADHGLTWSDPVEVTDPGDITFDEAYTDTNLQSPTVQASLHRYSWSDETDLGGENRILFAIPDHGRLRINMTVRLSYDEGDTWPVAKVIDPGPSGYSDLVVDAEDNIGLIYERGNDGGIYYTSFSLDWLEESGQ